MDTNKNSERVGNPVLARKFAEIEKPFHDNAFLNVLRKTFPQTVSDVIENRSKIARIGYANEVEVEKSNRMLSLRATADHAIHRIFDTIRDYRSAPGIENIDEDENLGEWNQAFCSGFEIRGYLHDLEFVITVPNYPKRYSIVDPLRMQGSCCTIVVGDKKFNLIEPDFFDMTCKAAHRRTTGNECVRYEAYLQDLHYFLKSIEASKLVYIGSRSEKIKGIYMQRENQRLAVEKWALQKEQDKIAKAHVLNSAFSPRSAVQEGLAPVHTVQPASSLPNSHYDTVA